MRNPWSKSFMGVVFGALAMMNINAALSDVGLPLSRRGSGSSADHRSAGQRAHRRWKQRRASGRAR